MIATWINDTQRRKGVFKIDPSTHICKCGNKIIKYHAKQCRSCYLKSIIKPVIKCSVCGCKITKRSKTGMCNKCYCNSRNDYRKSKPVLQYDLEGNLIKKWNSIYRIIKETFNDEFPFVQSPILSVCKGRRKTAYGFIWKYA